MVEKGQMVTEGCFGGYIKGRDGATWYPKMWAYIIKKLNIKSILDIGCGEGQSTEWFKDNVCDVLGIDGCKIAIDENLAPDNVMLHDFNNGKFETDKRYDMIWCCEFVEHVEEKYLNNILDTFLLGKYLLMTFALPGQHGHNHVNCRPEEYWIEKISAIGFQYSQQMTVETRDWAAISQPSFKSHYERKGLFFINEGVDV